MRHQTLHGICHYKPPVCMQRTGSKAKQSQYAINTYNHKLTLSLLFFLFTFALLSTDMFFAPALAGICFPKPLGRAAGTFHAVFVTGDYAYVTGAKGLAIFDVSDPRNPTFKGESNVPHFPYDVCVSGATAYVADFSNGLQMIDVSDPTTPGEVRNVFILVSTAYVADGPRGFQIIDVSDCMR